MATNVNTVCFSGNLGRDAELRETNDGGGILRFSVANKVYSKREENNEHTNWFDCVVFGTRAVSLAQYLKKGTRVFVTGRLNQSTYENRDGQKRSKVETIVSEIEFSNPRNDGGNAQPARAAATSAGEYAYDDIPF